MNNLMVIDGIEVRRDAYGRYSLNDLHRAAVASGANARTKEPGKFLSSQQITELVQELIDTQNLGVGSFNETTQNLGSKPVSKIEGRNGGTYVCKELVYAYAMWISPSFHLKVIRTFDMVTSTPEKLSGQLAEEERAQRQQHDLDIATVGMGDQQRQRYQVQLSLRQKYQQQLEQLRRDSEQKGTYNTDDYRKAEQALTESLNRQLNENRRYWQQLEVVQGNWKNGVLRAFQDFTVDADNTAGTAEQVFSSAFSNMGNGLATFVTTGKLNFKSFTSSVLSDMAKILAQATMMKSIKGIGSVLGFDLSSLSLNANGGIYQSADLSRYSGTVVNRPTFFAFAKGAGVMGEAGPEAILPLRRGADGKLGVVADIGGSGMAMFAPQYNIEINNDGTNGQIGPAALKVVYDLGKKAAADFMQQQARDGGRLSGAYR
ncbi:phage tail tape measure protein [Escherichia coli]|nr:phage tail tape measure protein [Escherichia coli]